MIKSEWIKLWSLRSTYWTLGIAAVLVVGVAAIFSSTIDVHTLDTPTDALQGGAFAQLAFGVLGVLTIAAEYSTGIIRTTFAAVPNRRKVILVKGGLLFAILYVAGQLIAAAAFFTAQAVLGSRGVHFSITDHGLAQSVTGMGFYMCFIGMFGFCLGALIRHTTGALATLFGLVFVVMGIIPNLLPQSMRESVGKFTFLQIAQSLTTAGRAAHSPDNASLLSVPTAWATCFVYLLVAIAVPLLIVNRRDAV
jgi:ABC-2 type transport system permease protein